MADMANSAVTNLRNAANSATTNIKNAANSAVTNVRNIVPDSQRTDVFYYVLIVSLLLTLGVITYFYSTIKEYLEDLFFKVKSAIFPSAAVGSSAEHPKPLSPPDRPSGLPGAIESDPLKEIGASLPRREEVFHISNNLYTYTDAAAVCRAYGADLATEDQVNDAYKRGADWCSYGWVKGQMAVFPTQQSTYDLLQKGPENNRDACGKAGVNGGYFDNPDLRFGVTCFGMKPDSAKTNSLTHAGVELPLSTEEIEFQKKVQRFHDQLDDIKIDPWNRSVWSSS